MNDLLDAFSKLGNDEELTPEHRAALLNHLKATIPKAERKAMRDQALVGTIEQLRQEGLELFPRPHGAIETAARQYNVGYSSAAKVWKAYRDRQEGEAWNLFLKNRNF